MPDYAAQVESYKNTWGLTQVTTDGDISSFAAEGSPEQYVVQLRQDTDKRLDLLAFGATVADVVSDLMVRSVWRYRMGFSDCSS